MQRLLPDLSSLSLPSFASSFSSLPWESRKCVFSLEICNDARLAPRVDAKWEVLPPGGARDHELALLTTHALGAAGLGAELAFREFKGTVSALVPDSANIAGLKLRGFATHNPELARALRGRWTAAAVDARRCDRTLCTVGHIATFKRDPAKLKEQ